jgi:hypothetical protein
MSERRCVNCKRPVAGHIGPTGVNCGLTTLEDLSEKPEKPENFEANGGRVPPPEYQPSDVTGKLDSLASQFERLLSTVGNLADRVEKAEAGHAAESTKHAAQSAQVAASLLLPKPSWSAGEKPVDAVKSSGTVVLKTPTEPVTTQSLGRDAELARLLDEYNADGSDGMLKAQDAVNAICLSTNRQGELKQKKPLLIPDVITSCLGICHDTDDIELLTSKGPSFKLQGRAKKPEAKDVSVAQWVTANISILEQLVPSFSSQELRDYLSYTKQIGDLLQIYTTEAIFTLDNEHREDVCFGNRKWCDISVHMDRFYLSHSLLKGSGGNSPSNASGTGGPG